MDTSNAVVEILKLTERPGVISMAGGLPAPDCFPMERIRESAGRVLREEGPAAMNYGPNPGYGKLREWLSHRMQEVEGFECKPENIFVSSGSLEAINLVATKLLDAGAAVVCGGPTFLSALHVFRTHSARISSVPVDQDGMRSDILESTLDRLEKEGNPARFVYLIPSFQNPSSVTLSLQRRREIAEICRKRSTPILEDHAYADLRYEGERLPSLKSLAPETTILIHTFSKIFGPGVRLGWAAADADVIEQLGFAKLGTDQCSNTLTQRLAFDYGSRGWIDDQIAHSIPLYRAKRDRMLQRLREKMPEGVSWTHPQGGFYIWVTLPSGFDSGLLLKRAVEEQKVAFVAGAPFFADGSGQRFLRLSFSFIPMEQIDEAIDRLSRLLH